MNREFLEAMYKSQLEAEKAIAELISRPRQASDDPEKMKVLDMQYYTKLTENATESNTYKKIINHYWETHNKTQP